MIDQVAEKIARRAILGILLGGLLVLSGMLLMAWNVFKTYRMAGRIEPSPVLAPAHA